MIHKHEFKGSEYTLIVKDASKCELNPGIRIRFYDNVLAEKAGVPLLEGIDLSVDELIDIVKSSAHGTAWCGRSPVT